jgi:hypothetical protein
MNVEIETEAKQFLFGEYFLRILGIVSLQCKYLGCNGDREHWLHASLET